MCSVLIQYCYFSDLSTLANVVTTLASLGKKEKIGGHIGDSVVKAFDTMAKVVIPQNNSNLNTSQASC